MKEIETLFFELIRVAIGAADSLSHIPSNKEWKALYGMVQKQSLVGVCFAGLQRLGADAYGGFSRIGIDEMLYLTWMGMAAKIQQRNEVVTEQCAELQARLSADGLDSAILKGQGIASLYCDHLRGLRQSGDIDLWIDGDRDAVLNYFREKGVKVSYTSIKHSQVEIFEDTEVEVHSRPSWFYSPIHDKRFMRWVDSVKSEQFENLNALGFCNPNVEFNLVFILIHIYRHLFEEGIGLRQLLDYYFVLLASSEEERKDAYDMVCKLGMQKFAAAVMYVLRVSFDLKEELMLCKESSERGRELLDEIMIGGNFGKFDTRYGVRRKGRLNRGFNTIERNKRFFCSYPSEILWAPAWKMWHWCWRMKNGYLKMK